MLLPSAFSYDIYGSCQAQRPQRPKLHSLEPYDSPSTARSAPAGLLASCRALQSMLGGSLQPVQPPQSPRTPVRPAHQQNPFSPNRRLQPPPRLTPAPRGANKRRRDDFEQDLVTKDDESESNSRTHNAYQTPKRQRRVPLDLPRGLNASDFDALETPREPSRSRQPAPEGIELFNLSEDTPVVYNTSSHRHDHLAWSPDDDRRLIAAVLGKLNLSNRDWNDCARQLGKDKDTLGRRWEMLVGKGNIGLRRGTGKMERTNLDVKPW